MSHSHRKKAVVRLAKAELDNVKEQMQRMQEEHKSNCQRHADMLTKVMSLIQAEPFSELAAAKERLVPGGLGNRKQLFLATFYPHHSAGKTWIQAGY